PLRRPAPGTGDRPGGGVPHHRLGGIDNRLSGNGHDVRSRGLADGGVIGPARRTRRWPPAAPPSPSTVDNGGDLRTRDGVVGYEDRLAPRAVGTAGAGPPRQRRGLEGRS